MEREREREEGKNDSVPQLHFFRGKNRSRNEKCYLPRLQLRVHTYTHTHTRVAHKSSLGSKSRNFSFLGMQPLIRGPPPPPSNDLHAARERRSPDLLLIAYRSPPLYQFPVKIIAFSRARPIFRSVIIVDNSCPPLSTASSSPKH